MSCGILILLRLAYFSSTTTVAASVANCHGSCCCLQKGGNYFAVASCRAVFYRPVFRGLSHSNLRHRPGTKNTTNILVKPELAFKSETNSMTLTRQLFAISISAICYLRKIYSKEYFRPRKIGILSMHMLQNVKSDPKITRFLKWVKGCFDAMKKGYLRDIIVAVQPPGQEDIGKALESYTFRIKYSDACNFESNTTFANSRLIKIDSSKISPKTLESSIFDCLYNCLEIVKNMPELPKGCSLAMMLTYYDGTPAEYQPPGFKACSYQAFEYPPDLYNIEVGKCFTPYHSISMGAIAKFVDVDIHTSDAGKQTNENCEVVENSQTENICNTSEAANMIVIGESNSPEVMMQLNTMTEDMGIYHDTSLDAVMFSPVTNRQLRPIYANSCSMIPSAVSKATNLTHFHNKTINIVERDVQGSPMDTNYTYDSKNKATPSDVVMDNDKDSDNIYEDVKILCVCENNDEHAVMILCCGCNFWSHGACYGFLSRLRADSIHICCICNDNHSRICNDEMIMALTSKHDRICLAFLRRILAFCKDRVQFSLDGMVRELGIPENFHSELFARIDKFGILRPVSPKQQSMTVKRTVKKRALAPFLKQYFRDGELSETAKNTDSCVDNSLRDIPGGAAPKRKPTNESDVQQMSSVNANKEPLAKRRRKVSDGY